MKSSRGLVRRVHESIFAKLLVTMLSMAAAILLMVGAFFAFVFSPNLGSSAESVIERSTALLASTSPGLEAAQRVARELDIEIRYEGPNGMWSTARDLPTVAEVRAAEAKRGATSWLRWRRYYLVDRPDGSTYLFDWRFAQKIKTVHDTFLVMLLTLLILVVFAAHAFIRHTLAPLRSLREAVARLSEGDLNVAVSGGTRDELGVLTNAFNRMVKRIKEMVQARDQLLLDVSHELRSPITRIKIALELLPPSETRNSLASDVAEMEAMVSEILEIERFKDGRGGLNRQRHDLASLLREVVEASAGTPPGVRLTGGQEGLALSIDPAKVKTVLKNLIENALKFSLPDSRPVEVSFEQGDRLAVVRISDNGPGIPSEDVAHLFEPFFRVDRSRSKRTGGYGLGLSICKRIMEAHGGSIDCEPASDRGATFVLTFPK